MSKIFKNRIRPNSFVPKNVASVSDLTSSPMTPATYTPVEEISGGSGETDLSFTASPTGGSVSSSTGDPATITLVDATNAGFMSPAQRLNLINLITLSGVAADAQNLGTFPGTIIPDNQTIKQALQALETSLASVVAGGLMEYDATNGARVTASGAGVTFAKAGGVGTFTIPAGVILMSAIINNGVTDDLDGSMNFKTVFNFTGTTNNTNTTNFNPPNIQVLNTTAAVVNSNNPSDSFAVVYDEGATPQRQVVLTASGDITTRVIGLDVYTNWALKFNF